MHTISFYSYKGGVGRSLAVYYFAKELSSLGKKVIVVDFDFEAPGLPYKFKVKPDTIQRGMVDYIHQFYTQLDLPESMADYLVQVPELGSVGNPVMMLPAGGSTTKAYWQKLHDIDWKKLLYQNDSYGQALFLEWQLRIEDEFKPDVLLIDSRTGVTDLTAVTLNLLADQVIVLGANNEENIDGSRMLLAMVADAPLLEFRKVRPRCHFVLTRVPEISKEYGEEKQRLLLERVKKDLNAGRGIASGPLVDQVFVVHSDDRLLWDEHSLTRDPRDYPWKIERDYYDMLGGVVGDTDLCTVDQVKELIEKRNVSALLAKAYASESNEEALDLSEQAIALNPLNADSHFAKGYFLNQSGRYRDAIVAHTEVIRLNPNIPEAYNNFGNALLILGKFEDALGAYDQAIVIEPKSAFYLLNRANLRCIQREPDKALPDISLAMSIDPNFSPCYVVRGHYYSLTGSFQTALDDYEKARKIDPTRDDPNNLAIVFFRMGNLEKALEYARKSFEKPTPTIHENHLTTAEIYSALGNTEDFYHHLEEAFKSGYARLNLLEPQTLQRHQNDPRFQALVKQYGVE